MRQEYQWYKGRRSKIDAWERPVVILDFEEFSRRHYHPQPTPCDERDKQANVCTIMILISKVKKNNHN